MVKSLFIVTCLAAVAAAAVTDWKSVPAEKQYLIKTKSILQLLLHVEQPLLIPELKTIADSYKIEEHIDQYEHVELVRETLTKMEKKMFLARGGVFTALKEEHGLQVKALFDVLYFAKDWDTFYKTAVWAREHVNEGVFVTALYTAVIHREDTKDIVLPSLFEVIPHMFINMETIKKAYEAKMKTMSKSEDVQLAMNYSGWGKTDMSSEMRVAYLTEDVGLNIFHYFYHMDYPYWMKGDVYGIKHYRRGEQFWYTHQQILARYLLERMTNGLPTMEKLTYHMPHVVGYAPNLEYKNGKAMPTRPELDKVFDLKYEDVELVMDFERRIRDTIDLGYVVTKKGVMIPLTKEIAMDVLGRLMEETVDSINPEFYGTLYHVCLKLVAHIVDPTNQHDLAPTALEHFETMLRDPMYYRVLARINDLFLRYKKTLPKYTKTELLFQGVKIETADVTNKLITYFENFKMDISNAIDVNKMEDDEMLKVIVNQPRLNHKPFSYKMVVSSEKVTNTMVRIFLGPKVDNNGKVLTLKEMQKYMIELDHFPFLLQPGKNIIERIPEVSAAFVIDTKTIRDIYKEVDMALKGKTSFMMDETMRKCGYPRRLLLPKGDKYGLPMTMFFMLSPLESGVKEKNSFDDLMQCNVNPHLQYQDTMPMGYPFDREIDETEIWVPNMMQKDVLIYHKELNTVDKMI